MNIGNITNIKILITNTKTIHTTISKSPEIFSKHKGYYFISESFAFNWYIFVALTNCCSHYNACLFDPEKLIEY